MGVVVWSMMIEDNGFSLVEDEMSFEGCLSRVACIVVVAVRFGIWEINLLLFFSDVEEVVVGDIVLISR
jgi:hypothetical protein